jgi:hypothetical protein
MVRWSWVDHGQIEFQLKQEPLAVGSTLVILLWQGETDPTGFRQERGAQETPVVLVEALEELLVSPSGP